MSIKISRKFEVSFNINEVLLQVDGNDSNQYFKDVSDKLSDEEASEIIRLVENEVAKLIGLFDFGHFRKEINFNSKSYLVSGQYSQTRSE